ncbi:lysophospholipid acyltransferase family protein [Acuticoccus mangrovi]|uniref:1-acyl-sn-glycerol-3-phosphate acyltransferase n=1 Tax=Acuticoccus mangrovi TaxID=2796142 RepID=A0A934IIN3_9HYPH|nr:lysophospholipid acyltransferase family protein [Acuticoccus mangrovi]MBJ3777183.1 1-acyl-sn-glycerol-3-phosphate acyltransferase [Acuticoccus mangrovi]
MTSSTADPSAKGPRRPGLAHAVAVARTAVYAVLATAYFIAMSVGGLWSMLFPARRMRWVMTFWIRGDLFLLRLIVGQRVEILGRQNLPTGPAIVAAKHQAAWETMVLVVLVDKGTTILKKELLAIPLYGWYARFFGMIPVDRSKGAAALKDLVVRARAAMDDGFQLVIYPEGTRRLPGAPPDYKPGTAYLYDQLKVPIVPIALNSGMFWPRRRFVRYPGTITLSVLPPIPAGLPRKEAAQRMQDAIERETDRLVTLAQKEISAS